MALSHRLYKNYRPNRPGLDLEDPGIVGTGEIGRLGWSGRIGGGVSSFGGTGVPKIVPGAGIGRL
jgi:hypothetical protein